MSRSEKMVRKNVVCEKCMSELRKEVRRYVTAELTSEFLEDLEQLYKYRNDTLSNLKKKWEAKLK